MKWASENGAGQSEENCENNPGNSAKGFDKQLAALADQGICDPAQLAGAAAQEAVPFGSGPDSLDVQNGAFFCDSSSGALIGDDDAVEHPPAHTAGRNELRHRPRRRDGELLRHDARGEAVRDPEQAP